LLFIKAFKRCIYANFRGRLRKKLCFYNFLLLQHPLPQTSAHILSNYNQQLVVRARVEKIQENLQEIGLPATCLTWAYFIAERKIQFPLGDKPPTAPR